MSKSLRDYKTGETMDCICILASVRSKETRQQKTFLNLEFSDSSGRVPGVMWEGFDEELARTAPGEIVRVQGRMESYNDRPQVRVTSILRPAPGTYDPRDFLPASKQDTDQMLAELDGIVESIENAPLKVLMQSMFGDDRLRRSFSMAPAAKRWHQPYLGGLLEHTLSVHYHAANMAGRYPEAKLDLVRAGALLHDIGKTVEYSLNGFIDFSTQGQLLGHLVIGVEILNEWIGRQAGFDEQTGWHLKHIILSHHGNKEYGSPVVPQTLEALIVHFADDLDSKMSGVLRIASREQDEPGDWTSYVGLMERKFFKSTVLPRGQSSKNLERPVPGVEKSDGEYGSDYEQPKLFDS